MCRDLGYAEIKRGGTVQFAGALKVKIMTKPNHLRLTQCPYMHKIST